MGACRYTIELTTSEGATAVELVRLNAVADRGDLVAEDGLPVKLAPGPHRFVVQSMMYGDTIEPNGEQTVLGEEARCETTFDLQPGLMEVHVDVRLVPQSCTITISMAEAIVD